MREEVWFKVLNMEMEHAKDKTVTRCTGIADEVLTEYEKRFPHTKAKCDECRGIGSVIFMHHKEGCDKKSCGRACIEEKMTCAHCGGEGRVGLLKTLEGSHGKEKEGQEKSEKKS